MPDRMWPRYRWSRGAIVGFTCFWVLWVSWAWWQADGWPYRWLYVPLLVLILLNGWWRWKLDVADERSRQEAAPMAPAGTAPMKAEDMFDRRDDGYRYELFEGQLVRMTPTDGRHSAVASRITRLVDEFAEGRDLGICGAAEPGFILRRSPDIVRAPDVCFVAKARIPATGIPNTYWPFAPDLAVEVISPPDRLADVHVKITEYFETGARLVWVVEPETRTVHVYRSPRDVQVLGIGDELDGDEVLPSSRCAVRRLFP